jgi:uncharacterized protein (TIGR03435 family)
VRRLILGASLFVVGCCCGYGQSTDSKLSFEVAVVKPASDPGGFRMMREYPGRIEYKNLGLASLVGTAYSVRDNHVIVPDSLKKELYDIVAKAPANSKRADLWLMLQTLLTERFHLTFHRETRDLPVYVLLVGNKGSRLQQVETSSRPVITRSPAGQRLAGKLSLWELTGSLRLDREVVDKTGLVGYFNITLEWTPDDLQPGRPDAGDSANAGSTVVPFPSAATALEEQLGLKLEPRKNPTEVIVVDHAEKIPIEN